MWTLRKLAPNSWLRGVSETSWRHLEASEQRPECLDAPRNLRWECFFWPWPIFQSEKGSQKDPTGTLGEPFGHVLQAQSDFFHEKTASRKHFYRCFMLICCKHHLLSLPGLIFDRFLVKKAFRNVHMFAHITAKKTIEKISINLKLDTVKRKTAFSWKSSFFY